MNTFQQIAQENILAEIERIELGGANILIAGLRHSGKSSTVAALLGVPIEQFNHPHHLNPTEDVNLLLEASNISLQLSPHLTIHRITLHNTRITILEVSLPNQPLIGQHDEIFQRIISQKNNDYQTLVLNPNCQSILEEIRSSCIKANIEIPSLISNSNESSQNQQQHLIGPIHLVIYITKLLDQSRQIDLSSTIYQNVTPINIPQFTSIIPPQQTSFSRSIQQSLNNDEHYSQQQIYLISHKTQEDQERLFSDHIMLLHILLGGITMKNNSMIVFTHSNEVIQRQNIQPSFQTQISQSSQSDSCLQIFNKKKKRFLSIIKACNIRWAEISYLFHQQTFLHKIEQEIDLNRLNVWNEIDYIQKCQLEMKRIKQMKINNHQITDTSKVLKETTQNQEIDNDTYYYDSEDQYYDQSSSSPNEQDSNQGKIIQSNQKIKVGFVMIDHSSPYINLFYQQSSLISLQQTNHINQQNEQQSYEGIDEYEDIDEIEDERVEFEKLLELELIQMQDDDDDDNNNYADFNNFNIKQDQQQQNMIQTPFHPIIHPSFFPPLPIIQMNQQYQYPPQPIILDQLELQQMIKQVKDQNISSSFGLQNAMMQTFNETDQKCDILTDNKLDNSAEPIQLPQINSNNSYQQSYINETLQYSWLPELWTVAFERMDTLHSLNFLKSQIDNNQLQNILRVIDDPQIRNNLINETQNEKVDEQQNMKDNKCEQIQRINQQQQDKDFFTINLFSSGRKIGISFDSDSIQSRQPSSSVILTLRFSRRLSTIIKSLLIASGSLFTFAKVYQSLGFILGPFGSSIGIGCYLAAFSGISSFLGLKSNKFINYILQKIGIPSPIVSLLTFHWKGANQGKKEKKEDQNINSTSISLVSSFFRNNNPIMIRLGKQIGLFLIHALLLRRRKQIKNKKQQKLNNEERIITRNITGQTPRPESQYNLLYQDRLLSLKEATETQL